MFRRKADLGIVIDSPLTEKSFLVRRCGRRVSGPFRPTTIGYVARIPAHFAQHPADSLVLFRDGKLANQAVAGDESTTLIVAPLEWPETKVAGTKIEVLRGSVRRLDPPFRNYQGHMFGVGLIDLKHLADDTTPSRDGSPVYIFEDKQQLGLPHSIHDDISKFGAGRFSHWGRLEFLFSSSDNSDPRTNGRTYEIPIAERDG